jgi:hypothetical protein
MKPKSSTLNLYHIGTKKEKYINAITTHFMELARRVGGLVILGVAIFYKSIINLN